MAKIFDEVPCETADDLLKELSPTYGRLWEGNRLAHFTGRDWMFRGVRSASWGLCPSAFRGDPFPRFFLGVPEDPSDNSGPVPEDVTAIEQRNKEDVVVTTFCSEADRLGFHIPGDSAELRDTRFAIPEYNPHEFPPRNKLYMYALAQHYGIPTRLLDWTMKPLVAGYFAVEYIAKVQAKLVGGELSDEPCAVWAADRGQLQKILGDKLLDPCIVLVTAPQATNPNLHAQGGLFTIVQPLTGDPQPLPNLDDVLIENAHKLSEFSNLFPLLVKFTLPAREARSALRLLEAEGVHAGTVFPGLAGVVQKMRERKAHCWPDLNDRFKHRP